MARMLLADLFGDMNTQAKVLSLFVGILIFVGLAASYFVTVLRLPEKRALFPCVLSNVLGFFGTFTALWMVLYWIIRHDVESWAWWGVELAIVVVSIVYGQFVLRDAARGITTGLWVCLSSPKRAFLSGLQLALVIPLMISLAGGIVVGAVFLLQWLGLVRF